MPRVEVGQGAFQDGDVQPAEVDGEVSIGENDAEDGERWSCEEVEVEADKVVHAVDPPRPDVDPTDRHAVHPSSQAPARELDQGQAEEGEEDEEDEEALGGLPDEEGDEEEDRDEHQHGGDQAGPELPAHIPRRVMDGKVPHADERVVCSKLHHHSPIGAEDLEPRPEEGGDDGKLAGRRGREHGEEELLEERGAVAVDGLHDGVGEGNDVVPVGVGRGGVGDRRGGGDGRVKVSQRLPVPHHLCSEPLQPEHNPVGQRLERDK
eukprot:768628-Hanusia_phi.AAC.8